MSFWNKQYRLFVQRSDGASVNARAIRGSTMTLVVVMGILLMGALVFLSYVFWQTTRSAEQSIESEIDFQEKELQRIENEVIRAQRMRNKLASVTQLNDGRRQVEFDLETELTSGSINWMELGNNSIRTLIQTYYPDRFKRTGLSAFKRPHPMLEELDRLVSDDGEHPVEIQDQRHLWMPIGWPLAGYVESHFGDGDMNWEGDIEFHLGADLIAPLKTPVKSTADGFVVLAQSLEEHGQTIMIQHPMSYMTVYSHLDSMSVSAGDKIKRGQVIGALGNTGLTKKPHLHYEVRHHGLPKNPIDFMGTVVVVP